MKEKRPNVRSNYWHIARKKEKLKIFGGGGRGYGFQTDIQIDRQATQVIFFRRAKSPKIIQNYSPFETETYSPLTAA